MSSESTHSTHTSVDSTAVAPEDTSLLGMRARYSVHLSAISRDPFECDMVKFVMSWHSYGGGPRSLIFEEFGLTEREFFRRVFVLVRAPTACLAIGRGLSEQLVQMCRYRLAIAGSSPPQ